MRPSTQQDDGFISTKLAIKDRLTLSASFVVAWASLALVLYVWFGLLRGRQL